MPDTPERLATWRGVVVTAFTTDAAPCSVRSSAAAVLAATVGDAPTWSLVTLGWVYVVLTALGVGIAVAALAAVTPGRAALLALPVLPLVIVPWWSRFFVSTYDEPAGLLGTVWVVLGLLVVAATRSEHRATRLAALALVAVGGLVAATAKPGFVPVGVVATAACAVVVLRGRWLRAAGPIAACLVVAVAAAPVTAALRAQDETYPQVNTHNLIFTVLLPELGPQVAGQLSLPPSAARASGEGYYWAFGADVPEWGAVIGSRPLAARADARALLAEHPEVLARMMGRGLTATMRPALPYLPSVPRGAGPESNEVRTVYPEAGALTVPQLAYLDGIALGWIPAVVTALAVGAGQVTLRPAARRRPRGTTVGLVRLAATFAVLALGIIGLAVLGDGYYELTKHVWLASYLLVVGVGLGVVATALSLTASRRRPSG